jgi:hypothetical protein
MNRYQKELHEKAIKEAKAITEEIGDESVKGESFKTQDDMRLSYWKAIQKHSYLKIKELVIKITKEDER